MTCKHSADGRIRPLTSLTTQRNPPATNRTPRRFHLAVLHPSFHLVSCGCCPTSSVVGVSAADSVCSGAVLNTPALHPMRYVTCALRSMSILRCLPGSQVTQSARPACTQFSNPPRPATAFLASLVVSRSAAADSPTDIRHILLDASLCHRYPPRSRSGNAPPEGSGMIPLDDDALEHDRRSSSPRSQRRSRRAARLRRYARSVIAGSGATSHLRSVPTMSTRVCG